MKTKFLNLALAAVLAVAIVGCGGKSNETNEKPGSEPTEKKVVAISTVGAVSGTVTLDGKPVPAKPINMSAEPYCQKEHPKPVVPPEVVVDDKGDLSNVEIYVKEGLGDYMFDTPKEPVVLNQKGCMYDPHIIALMTGQTFEVKNDDQTTHNIHPMPKDNREWNK